MSGDGEGYLLGLTEVFWVYGITDPDFVPAEIQ